MCSARIRGTEHEKQDSMEASEGANRVVGPSQRATVGKPESPKTAMESSWKPRFARIGSSSQADERCWYGSGGAKKKPPAAVVWTAEQRRETAVKVSSRDGIMIAMGGGYRRRR